MKLFEHYLSENFTSGVEGYSKPVSPMKRHKLPNLDDYDSFYDDLIQSGHNITQYNDYPDGYTPTQSEYNEDKVENIIKSRKTLSPILVSSDDYIVDGHHRWKAAVDSGKNIDIKKISLPYYELMSFLNDKSYVVNKKIHENKG